MKLVICEVGGVDPTRGGTSEPPPEVRSGAHGDSTAQIQPGEVKTEIKEGRKERNIPLISRFELHVSAGDTADGFRYHPR